MDRTQQGQERPFGRTQDGVPVVLPLSHVEMEWPTDPKRLAGGSIKIYHADPEVAFEAMERYAAKYVTLLETINTARKASFS